MSVIRINRNSGYVVMSNAHFFEKDMSLKAKGLLSLMLSLPDEWVYSIKGLSTLSKDGYSAVMVALQELEKFGYLERKKTFSENGRFSGYDYEVFEVPPSRSSYCDFPITEKPSTEKPSTENRTLSNIKQSNIKQSNINLINTVVNRNNRNNVDRNNKVTENNKKQHQRIVLGIHKNILISQAFYEDYKLKYNAIYTQVVNALSDYKKKNNIKSCVNDERFLTEWAEKDEEIYKAQKDIGASSFDTEEFFNLALRRSYGK